MAWNVMVAHRTMRQLERENSGRTISGSSVAGSYSQRTLSGSSAVGDALALTADGVRQQRTSSSGSAAAGVRQQRTTSSGFAAGDLSRSGSSSSLMGSGASQPIPIGRDSGAGGSAFSLSRSVGGGSLVASAPQGSWVPTAGAGLPRSVSGSSLLISQESKMPPVGAGAGLPRWESDSSLTGALRTTSSGSAAGDAVYMELREPSDSPGVVDNNPDGVELADEHTVVELTPEENRKETRACLKCLCGVVTVVAAVVLIAVFAKSSGD